MADEIIVSDPAFPVTEINVDDVTTSDFPGQGCFDEFMQAHQVRLENEYNKGRIKGTEYAKVYLGAMESSMSQAIQFILNRQESTAKASLIYKQGQMVEVEIFNAIKQGQLIDKQIIKMDSEIALLDKEVIKMDSEIALLEQQVINLALQEKIIDAEILLKNQEILLMDQQILKMEQEVLLMISEVELNAQKILLMEQEIEKMIAEVEIAREQLVKLAAEIRLIDQQILNAEQEVLKSKQEIELLIEETAASAAKTDFTITKREKTYIVEGQMQADYIATVAQTQLVEQQKVLSVKQEHTIDLSDAKLEREERLLEIKGWTEAAQTQEFILLDDGGKAFVSDNSIIGKQRRLYQAQTDGFQRDAEQKLAKIVADSYSVQRSTDEGLAPPTTLNEASTNIIMHRAGQGINVEI